ncbi:DNA gyrase inhibitor YacG [Deferrisoma camini]|uniref:DNA gyrase inhibitor YacG n=1 Tax=Deferrisoma camini TaxID=1035120 RepID=UPI00046D4AD8|nr:DNA gyrase inhibitor YacG [Deferrisoma camini]
MTVRCPTCKAPVVWKDNPYRPFCSERCRLTDLGRWLREDYRIPAEEDESETPPDPETLQ